MPIKGNPFLKHKNPPKSKPCPNCGSNETTIKEDFLWRIQTECKLRCLDCGFTLIKRTTKKAVKKWNRSVENDR